MARRTSVSTAGWFPRGTDPRVSGRLPPTENPHTRSLRLVRGPWSRGVAPTVLVFLRYDTTVLQWTTSVLALSRDYLGPLRVCKSLRFGFITLIITHYYY